MTFYRFDGQCPTLDHRPRQRSATRALAAVFDARVSFYAFSRVKSFSELAERVWQGMQCGIHCRVTLCGNPTQRVRSELAAVDFSRLHPPHHDENCKRALTLCTRDKMPHPPLSMARCRNISIITWAHKLVQSGRTKRCFILRAHTTIRKAAAILHVEYSTLDGDRRC